MIANKEQKDEVVEHVSEYILLREGIRTEAGHDVLLRICNEELYNFLDFVFVLANEYNYTTGYEIRRNVVDTLYDIKTRAYNKEGIQIYFYDLYFLDMQYLYEEYQKTPLAIQRKAQLKHGRI